MKNGSCFDKITCKSKLFSNCTQYHDASRKHQLLSKFINHFILFCFSQDALTTSNKRNEQKHRNISHLSSAITINTTTVFCFLLLLFQHISIKFFPYMNTIEKQHRDGYSNVYFWFYWKKLDPYWMNFVREMYAKGLGWLGMDSSSKKMNAECMIYFGHVENGQEKNG